MPRPALFLLALTFPLSAAAASVTVWDFTNGTVPGRWEVNGLAATQQTPEGLYIRADGDVRIYREVDPPVAGDIVHIDYRIARDTEAELLWRPKGGAGDRVVHLPFVFANEKGTIGLDTAWYDEWDTRVKRLGLHLPAGTEVRIERITLTKLNPFEKAWEAVLSLWMFDFLRPSSINYLWGPLLATNPVRREMLWQNIPPMARSANIVFYALLIIAAAFLGGRRWWRGASLQGAVVPFFVFAAALWIFYDLRMGAEILGYAKTDYETYFAPPAKEASFRDRENFPAFAEAAAPFVGDRERYAYLGHQAYPFLGLMRYATYPALPTMPTEPEEGIDTWIVYNRPEVTVQNGVLVSEGQPLTQPGILLLDWKLGSFVFRETP